jgi:hypothetical protein
MEKMDVPFIEAIAESLTRRFLHQFVVPKGKDATARGVKKGHQAFYSCSHKVPPWFTH